MVSNTRSRRNDGFWYGLRARLVESRDWCGEDGSGPCWGIVENLIAGAARTRAAAGANKPQPACRTAVFSQRRLFWVGSAPCVGGAVRAGVVRDESLRPTAAAVDWKDHGL